MDPLFKDKLSAAMSSFCELCRKEDLRWFMAFGSAIGTVRHGGLIPWDDDIDVYMPRADAARLLELVPPQGYEIIHFSKDPSLPFSYIKYCDASSTIWEMYKYPYVTGVFIDVFILDEAPGADVTALRADFWKKLINYKRSLRTTTLGSWLKSSIHDKFAAIQDVLWYHRRKGSCYRQLLEADKAVAEISARGGDKYVLYDNIYPDSKVIYDKALFDSFVEASFEGISVRLPSGNHQLLTQIYGDYMTPPPEDKRCSGHHLYFIDLERRIGVRQIKSSQ